MRSTAFFVPFFFLFSASLLPAQPPKLLADLNRSSSGPVSSSPSAFTYDPSARHLSRRFAVTAGGNYFFRAFDPSHGEELWMGRGIRGLAGLVKDIVPGRIGSGPWDFLVFGNKVYFSAYTPSAGREPWVSDGTAAGTKRLADLLPGPEDGGFYTPVRMGGSFYFFARVSTGPDVYALFRYDGKSPAPVRVAGGFTEPWKDPVAAGSFLLFQGATSASGREAWVSDGTSKGTFMLRDYAGTLSGYCRGSVAAGKEVWFCGRDGRGWAVWKTGGRKALRAADLPPPFQYWFNPMAVGNSIVFQGPFRGGPGTGNPYYLDRKTGKIGLLKKIASAGWYVGYASPVRVGKRIYFFGFDSLSTPPGPSIWATDGTPAGTVRLVPPGVLPGRTMVGMESPALSGNLVFFHVFSTYPMEDSLWRTDGTPAGTIRLQGSSQGTRFYTPSCITPLSKGAVFRARTPQGDMELFSSDGTPKGSGLLQDLAPGRMTGSSDPWGFTDALGRTFFFTRDPATRAMALWATDGSTGGTRQLVSGLFSSATDPFSMGGRVFFSAYSTGRWGLWVSDGTAGGTRNYFSAPPGSNFQLLEPLALGERIVFLGRDKGTGFEPWVTDGTARGTMILKDVRPGSASSKLGDAVTLGRNALFSPDGSSLWITDGTKPGTRKLSPNFVHCRNLVRMGGKVFFEGMETGSRTGIEPWVSDGTLAGTKEMVDLNPGSFDGFFSSPVASGKYAFFLGNDGRNVPYKKLALFRTDGTATGTVLLVKRTIDRLLPVEGPWGRNASGVPLEGNRIVFWTVESGRVYGPWVSDGTPKGTFLLKDLGKYFSSGGVEAVRLGAGKVLFRPLHLNGQVWITDGTKAGTRPYPWLMDPFALNPSFPPVLSGGMLFFSARDPARGVEPWVLFPGATAQEAGTSTSPARLSATDPVLGGSTTLSLEASPPGAAALLLLGRRPARPLELGYGFRIYLDAALGFLWAGPFGPGGRFTFRVPNDPVLAGAGLAAQGLFFPTASPPFGLDLTNGVFLTPGR